MEFNFPEWLERIFVIYAHRYGQLWVNLMPTIESKKIQKSIWLDRLSRFNEDTVLKAINKSLDNQYPDLSIVVELCEEFSRTRRYLEMQITFKSHDPSPLLAEYMENEHIDKKMSVEEAREWFRNLKNKLKNKVEQANGEK